MDARSCWATTLLLAIPTSISAQEDPFAPRTISGASTSRANAGDDPAAKPPIAAPANALPAAGATTAASDPALDESLRISAQLQSLVKLRQTHMQEFLAARDRQDVQSEVACAYKLAVAEHELLELAETIPYVEPAELAGLRDAHAGLLGWLASHAEKAGDLSSAQSFWSDTHQQLAKLLGAAHWKTRTAAVEEQRIACIARLSGEAQTQIRRAEQLHAAIATQYEAGNLPAALTAGSEALAIRTELFGASHPQTALTLELLGIVLADTGDLAEAEKKLRTSAVILQDHFGDRHPETLLCLSNLADVLRDAQRFDEAAELQIHLIRATESDRPTQQHAVALAELSRTYTAANNLAAAQAVSDQAFAALHAATDASAANFVAFHDHRAKLLRKLNQVEGAEESLRSAVTIARGLGEQHPSHFQALNNLAVFLLEQEHLLDAHQIFDDALRIAERTMPADHPQRARLLVNVGDLRHQQGRMDEAAKILDEATAVLRKNLGPNSLAYATALNNRALVDIQRGHLQSAAELLGEALEIHGRQVGQDHASFLLIVENLARLHTARNRGEQAKQFIQQAATVAVHAFGENNPQYARHLVQLGELASEAKEHGLAEALILQGTTILEREIGQKHPEAAKALKLLGQAAIAQQQPDRGEELLKQCVATLADTVGEKHPEYAEALTLLAEVYITAKRFDVGQSTVETGLRILENTVGRQHPQYAHALRLLARVHAARNDPIQAELLLADSLEILKQTVGELHPEYLETLDSLAAVTQLLGKTDRTAVLRQTLSTLQSQCAEQAACHAITRLDGYVDRFVTQHVPPELRQSGLPSVAIPKIKSFDNRTITQ